MSHGPLPTYQLTEGNQKALEKPGRGRSGKSGKEHQNTFPDLTWISRNGTVQPFNHGVDHLTIQRSSLLPVTIKRQLGQKRTAH
jgi:hypothetical protein